MKEKGFNSDNIIKFKTLADKIEKITDGELNADDCDIDELIENGYAEIFGQMLSEELSKPCETVTDEELYEEIVDNYFILINELGIKSFNFFRFSNYDYGREIIVDGKEYDLDGEFCHDDLEATEALCAIDCLIADIDDEDEENILKQVERMINIKKYNN